MRKRIKRIIAGLSALILLIVFLTGATRILTPARDGYGCLWGAFKEEPADSMDVLFCGSSMVYCNVIPAEIYQKSGIASYVLSGPVQTMPETYYYIEEALKTQSPKVLILELSALFYERMPNFDLLNIGYMPWTMNRVKATFASVPPEEWIQYFFPLHVYHSRWDEITKDDWSKALSPDQPDPRAGYTFISGGESFPETEEANETCTEESYRKAERWLAKIARLCKARGIRLIGYLSPRRNVLRAETEEWFRETLKALSLEFYDLNEKTAEAGINPEADYFDRTHLNSAGALKFSGYLADFLSETLGIPASDIKDPALWQARLERLEKMFPEE